MILPLLQPFKTDVTRRKKLESEVKKQRDQLDQLHKEKVMLLENLSHEIRNPLNGISGFLDLLISEVTDYNQRKLLKSIKHSSERIRNRLDAVTDILNIEKDSWQINLKTSDISNVLSEVLAYYREMAEEKGLRFDTYIQENLKVVTDPQLISKAVGNLLDNAVKFTTEGSIRVEILSPPVEGGEIIIKVTDTGSGIKKRASMQFLEILRKFR
ncbi:MAG: HAMP domain-containing histidine kinase [Ignavibacteriales bacterium]|nr:HAMP domain-containing histidine kinase [Ignavibacteriales bacterium]